MSLEDLAPEAIVLVALVVFRALVPIPRGVIVAGGTAGVEEAGLQLGVVGAVGLVLACRLPGMRGAPEAPPLLAVGGLAQGGVVRVPVVAGRLGPKPGGRVMELIDGQQVGPIGILAVLEGARGGTRAARTALAESSFLVKIPMRSPNLLRP